LEAFRHHANHGARLAVEVERLADDFRVATEARPPKAIAENDDAVAAGLVFLIRKYAAEHR
jgi:hypothetical protein